MLLRIELREVYIYIFSDNQDSAECAAFWKKIAHSVASHAMKHFFGQSLSSAELAE